MKYKVKKERLRNNLINVKSLKEIKHLRNNIQLIQVNETSQS